MVCVGVGVGIGMIVETVVEVKTIHVMILWRRKMRYDIGCDTMDVV